MTRMGGARAVSARRVYGQVLALGMAALGLAGLVVGLAPLTRGFAG